MVESWRNQVRLLLAVLPEMARADDFALHGGTAINLFVQEMRRLSVDIDGHAIPAGVQSAETRLGNLSIRGFPGDTLETA